MEVIQSGIEGLIEIIPTLFGDERGYFLESYNKNKFDKILPGIEFVQDNQSYSTAGVLRGLHFQKPPFAQGKLVRVITGKVIDAVVDLRKESPTFGESRTFILDSKKQNMVYVPEGFAHGFATLEPSVFVYKCTNIYHQPSEGGVLWNDPELKIDWQVNNPTVSEKDKVHPILKDIKNELPF